MPMKQLKKLTVLLPDELVRAATKATRQGITPTLRLGLKLVAAKDAYETLRGLRGKAKLGLSWKQLRRDR
jgi:hypothetical protein